MWKIWKTTSQTESLSWNQREREACGCGLNIDIDFKICTLHRRETRRLSKKRNRRANKKKERMSRNFSHRPKNLDSEVFAARLFLFLFILPPLENKSWLATYPILTLKSSVQRDFQWKISIPERVWIQNLVGSQIQLFYRIRKNLCATFYHVLWEHLDDCNVNLKRHTKVDWGSVFDCTKVISLECLCVYRCRKHSCNVS